MKLLLVEDSSRKAEKIQSFVQREFSVPLAVEKSYRGALKRMDSEAFDIVLLDMSLPTFDPSAKERFGRPRPLGGREIMGKMVRRKLRARVIVVTQLDRFGTGDEEYTFEQVVDLCKEEFPKLFAGAVFFSQSDNKWEAELKGKILSALTA